MCELNENIEDDESVNIYEIISLWTWLKIIVSIKITPIKNVVISKNWDLSLKFLKHLLKILNLFI